MNDANSKPRIPRTSIDRLAADAVPGMQIHGDTREALAECAMEFVQLVADAAQEKCSAAGRVQLNAADALAALDELGFGKYRAPADAYAAASSQNTGRGEAGTTARKLVSGGAKSDIRKKRPHAAACDSSSEKPAFRASDRTARTSTQYNRLKHGKLSDEEQRELAEEQHKLFAAAAAAAGVNSGK